MSEEMLIQHCSPTLAGMKTGNIFSCRYSSESELKKAIRAFNKRLCKKGLRIIPIRFKDGRALIYVYRPSSLQKDLYNSEARDILTSCGYECASTHSCVKRLMERLAENGDFPHEIGLFLGYPPIDVRGFILERDDKPCGKCKCVGHWKVYGDAEQAQMLFSRYKKCTAVYTDRWSRGKSIESLTVGSAR